MLKKPTKAERVREALWFAAFLAAFIAFNAVCALARVSDSGRAAAVVSAK